MQNQERCRNCGIIYCKQCTECKQMTCRHKIVYVYANETFQMNTKEAAKHHSSSWSWPARVCPTRTPFTIFEDCLS